MTKYTRKNRGPRRNRQNQYCDWDNLMTSINEKMIQKIVKMNTTITNQLNVNDTYSSLSENSRHAFFSNSHGMLIITDHIPDYKMF